MSIHAAVETSKAKMLKGPVSVRVEKVDGGFLTHTGKDGTYPDKKKVHKNLAGVVKHMKSCYGGAEMDNDKE